MNGRIDATNQYGEFVMRETRASKASQCMVLTDRVA